jgi:hypothetical protein
MIVCGALEAAFPGLGGLALQFLVGSAEGGMSPAGIGQGFASGFNYRNLPWLLRRKFVLPYWIFTLERVQERNYAAARILVDHPKLGALGAISPVNLINLRQALELEPDRFLADLESGGLTVEGKPAVAGRYRSRPNPELARELAASRARTGRFPDRLLFPSLQVLISWRGGNMSYYLDELNREFAIDRHFEFPISASEGLFAIPVEADRTGGAVAVTTHFLEFIPDRGPVNQPALRADQLELGAEYRLIVTNSGGLYRYDMEDIVRVTSRFHRTPVIEFVSRKDRQISVANERLTERDVTVAMEVASREEGIWYRDFLFVPCSDRRYRVVLDGGGPARANEGLDRADGLVRLARAVERQLRAAAKGYDFEREDGLLQPLELVVTAPGQLTELLRRREGHQALPNAQLKPLHLTNEFDLVRRLTAVWTYAA